MSVQTRSREFTGLHQGILGNLQVLAQSVSGIGPSIGAAALIPLAFADAGYGAWMTVVLATLGILGVGVSIGTLAQRHASTGALYTLVPQGLGAPAGLLTGVVMMLNMLVTGPFLALGVGMYFSHFLSGIGVIHPSPGVITGIDLGVVVLVGLIAYLDIRISTTFLLLLEATSMLAILVMLGVVLVSHGHVVDPAQISLHGTTAHGLLLGVVFLVLAYGSFEGSASLGIEARRPRAIWVALIGSVVVVGIFFVVNAYIQVLGFEGTGMSLAAQSSPLSSLATYYHVSWLGDIVTLGVAFSFFGALNAWLNYIPRMVFTMSHDGVLPKVLGKTHARTGSPHVAVVSWSLAWLVVLGVTFLAGVNQSDAFGNFGTLSGYCFTLVYLLAAVAAPVYLARIGKLSALVLVGAVVGAVVMALEFWFSFNPLPAAPTVYFVWVFVGTVVLTLVATGVLYAVAPSWLKRVGVTRRSEDNG